MIFLSHKQIFGILVFLLLSPFSKSNTSYFIEGKNNFVLDSLTKVASQSKDETKRIDANNHLGSYYESISNYDLALKHLYTSEKLNSGQYPEKSIYCYNYLGYIFWHKSDYKKALYYHRKALSIAQEKNIKDNQNAYTYLMLGSDYYDLGDYKKTSKYYFQSLKLYEKLNDKVGRIMINNRLSKLYLKLKDYKRSKLHALKAQEINLSINYVREKAISYNCLGNVYIELNETGNALYYFKKTLLYFEKSGDIIGQAIACINLGDTHFQHYKKHKGEFNLDEAFNYYQKSYRLNSIVTNKFGMIYGLMGIAEIEAERKQQENALQNYLNALALSESINAKYEQTTIYYKIHLLYDQIGQVNKSHSYLKKFVDLKSMMENDEQTKALIRQESKYELSKKIDEKNAELSRNRMIEKERSRSKNNIIVSIVIIMLVLAYTVYNSIKKLRTIQLQNNLISSINTKLKVQTTEITDSITYARRIQDAILPSENFLKNQLVENFILYQPKDIIAGDFYWMEIIDEKIFVAVADCTGHGVPGAIVSVICSNALNRSVLEFKISDPGEILNKTRELVLDAFSKSDQNVTDGMDISLICLNPETRHLLWAGANIPLWYINNKELHELTPTKQPIGNFENPTSFLTHSLVLDKGDVLYLFSDGYADQFGGEKGKKFKSRPLKNLLLENAYLSMEEQKRVLEKTLHEWKGNLEQVDDICFMGLRI